MTDRLPDLTPARWIWLPSERTLPNTFVRFRRTVTLERPVDASGWISADSRYLLRVNGGWVQWGPAPCDPRTLEADPIDLSDFLVAGENEIEVAVLFYGHGDGTWVYGKPGLLFVLDLVDGAGGSRRRVVSDAAWSCCVDPQRPPGRAKRWYLRALQEVADLRGEAPAWVPALELDAPADKPPLCSSYPDYLTGMGVEDPSTFSLVPRAIPRMKTWVADATPVEAHRIDWKLDPETWFDFRMPDAFTIGPEEVDGIRAEPARPAPVDGGAQVRPTPVELPAQPAGTGRAVTFDLGEQLIGWPWVEIDAPAGTVVEVMLQEAHEPGGSAWLDTHHFRWLRFTCAEGANRFEAFDYDSVRWIQVHVHGNAAPVAIRRVGLRAREYAFAARPAVRLGEEPLQRLIDACLRTVRNGAQETLVDCMGRERQQYSGDIGHEAVAVMSAFGESRQPARYLRTWSQGQTGWGWFLDCWPAHDRTNRVPQRLLGLTGWGPILDHSAQFALDAWRYMLFIGDRSTVEPIFARLVRLLDYFETEYDEETGYDVESLPVPSVWIDHDAYLRQRHKQCAYNLVVAASLQYGVAPLARATGDEAVAGRADALAGRIVETTRRRFWSDRHGTFVVNLPWLEEEGGPRYCDRSLATATLCGYTPEGRVERSIDILASRPEEMGYSYVPNQFWRHRALVRSGRPEVVVGEYRDEWSNLDSVVRNGTISEHWVARPDTRSQYSHGGVVPLLTLYSDLAGVRPTSPGFARYVVEPRLADLLSVDLTTHTPIGPIRLESELAEETGGPVQRVRVTAAPGGAGELVVPADGGPRRVPLEPGTTLEVTIPPDAMYDSSPVTPGEYL